MARLDITPLFLIISALVVSSWAENLVQLTLHPPGPYKRGDSVKFECKTPPLSPLDLVMFTKEVNGVEYDLSTNGRLAKAIQDTGRYQMMLNDSGEKVTAQITISGIEGVDSGNIICKLYKAEFQGNPASEHSAQETFEVQVPPKSVEIQHYRNGQIDLVEPDGTALLQDKEDGGIICKVEVDGSSQFPTTTITLDGVDVTGSFSAKDDVTNQADVNGFWQRGLVIEYEYLTNDPDIAWNDKQLKCSAQMDPIGEFDPIEASAKVEVHYAPRLTCNEVFSKVGEMAELTCSGSMNPIELLLAEVSWGKKPDKIHITLESPDHERHHLKVNDNENGNYDFVLTIDAVQEPDFGVYRFEVQNAHSHKEIRVDLKEVVVTTPTPTTTPATIPDGGNPDIGASSSGTAQFLSSTVALLFAMLLTLHFS